MMKRIAVTMGDPAGVGPEVLAGALRRFAVPRGVVVIVFGSRRLLERSGLPHQGPRGRSIILCDPADGFLKAARPGRPSVQTGRAAWAYLEEALGLMKSGGADALVTAPVSKEILRLAGFRWAGQTEYLAYAMGVRQVEMVFASERFRVVLVTRHVSLKEAIRGLKKDRIIACGRMTVDLLRRRFGIRSPRILVCGLNPHAGEAGLFGREEVREIAPAIRSLSKEFPGVFSGPEPADAVFHKAFSGASDMVMAMYHDQALIPFKMTEFSRGVHLTAGLPFIRTSPVHGTAYDIAGKKIADCGSMLSALRLASDLAHRI